MEKLFAGRSISQTGKLCSGEFGISKFTARIEVSLLMKPAHAGLRTAKFARLKEATLRKYRERKQELSEVFRGLPVRSISIDDLRKTSRELDVALANVEKRNEFTLRIHCDEYPLVAIFGRITLADTTRFLLHVIQISSSCKYLGQRSRIIVSIKREQRAPTRMGSRMIVLRFRPVSRSVVRIEQPSTRH